MAVSIPYRYDKNKTRYALFFDSLVFQFLIGTIKTQNRVPLPLPAKSVSIPYRYDKNIYPGHCANSSLVVSIPYRYDKNFIWKGGRRELIKFQFLIGTIKTSDAARVANRGKARFNSL